MGGKEVTRATRELPRLPAAPYTQEDMDQRIRERLARERARAELQNPLPGIIRDEDWNKLEQDAPTQTPTGRCKPMPVYPQLQRAIEQISGELDDARVVTSNIMRADNIRREAGASLEQVLDALREARYATHTALSKGRIIKRDESGKLLKMPYFFECLRQKLGLPKQKRV